MPGRSCEHAVQVPRRKVAVLAVDPEGLALRIHRDVVIAPRFLALPPPRLNALGPGAQRELALERGKAVPRDQLLRPLEEPRRTCLKPGDAPRGRTPGLEPGDAPRSA